MSPKRHLLWRLCLQIGCILECVGTLWNRAMLMCALTLVEGWCTLAFFAAVPVPECLLVLIACVLGLLFEWFVAAAGLSD